MNKIENDISHLEGPIGSLWTRPKWPGGLKRPEKRPFLSYLATLANRQSQLPQIGWALVEQGRTLYPTSGGRVGPVWTHRKLPLGGREGHF